MPKPRARWLSPLDSLLQSASSAIVFQMEIEVSNDCLQADPSFGSVAPSSTTEVERATPNFASGQLHKLHSGDVLRGLHDGCVSGIAKQSPIIHRQQHTSRFGYDS